MEMTILERDDDITHIALTGRLDTTAADEIDKAFSDAVAARKQPAIIDLSGIEFMASRGIGLLFANSKRLMKDGLKLILLNPKGMVDAILKSSKMDKVMPIAYDLDEALRMLGREPKTGAALAQPVTEVDEAEVPQQSPGPTTCALVGTVLKLVTENTLTEFDTLNARVTEFLGFHSVPTRAAYAIDLAIEELLVNVIRYAFIDDETHLIDLELAIESDQLVLQITDDGRPFDPREPPEFNPHCEDGEVGGLGLILVLDVVDTLSYERREDKNWVEVRVRLVAEDQAGEASEPLGDVTAASDV